MNKYYSKDLVILSCSWLSCAIMIFMVENVAIFYLESNFHLFLLVQSLLKIQPVDSGCALLVIHVLLNQTLENVQHNFLQLKFTVPKLSKSKLAAIK